jgi:hypothetical protein
MDAEARPDRSTGPGEVHPSVFLFRNARQGVCWHGTPDNHPLSAEKSFEAVVATSSIADRPRQMENSRGANNVVRRAVKNYWANTTSASCAKDLVLDAPGPSAADDPARGTAGCGKSRSKENTGMNVPWSSVSQEFLGCFSDGQGRPWLWFAFCIRNWPTCHDGSDGTFPLYGFKSARVHLEQHKNMLDRSLSMSRH